MDCSNAEIRGANAVLRGSIRTQKPEKGADVAEQTLMAREIAEIPDIVARQLRDGGSFYRETGAELRARAPRLFVTCARGSSDHAATYFKYLVETRLGLPVASIGPSVASVYGARLQLADTACLTISQSGASPDLVALQERARSGGAHAIAMVNRSGSPVGNGADTLLPLLAGEEWAVAATKSYVASMVALASLFAGMTGDDELEAAIRSLPDVLAETLAHDRDSEALDALRSARSLFAISRGSGMAIAGEAALKLKETCRLHAEAYSAAEVRHGPIVLARDRFAAIVFVPRDESRSSVLEAARTMAEYGATVFRVDTNTNDAHELTIPAAPHLLLQPICQIAAFYRFVEKLARRLGENPDAPPHLKKVTQTS